MARGKVVVKTQRIVRVPGKGGVMKAKKVTMKNVTKATNQAKGAGVQRVLKTDAAKLKAQQIQTKENIAKAKILGRNTDVASITGGLASTIQSGFGRIQSNNEQRDVSNMKSAAPGVDQVINGGAQTAGNQRDDDDEDENDNPYVD